VTPLQLESRVRGNGDLQQDVTTARRLAGQADRLPGQDARRNAHVVGAVVDGDALRAAGEALFQRQRHGGTQRARRAGSLAAGTGATRSAVAEQAFEEIAEAAAIGIARIKT